MSEIDERLMDLVKRRSNLPASIAVMETHTHAQRINACLADLESNMMRLAACWDGELDPIGAFSQLSYLHEKVGRAESAARSLRKEIEKISGWDQPAPRESRRVVIDGYASAIRRMSCSKRCRASA